MTASLAPRMNVDNNLKVRIVGHSFFGVAFSCCFWFLYQYVTPHVLPIIDISVQFLDF